MATSSTTMASWYPLPQGGGATLPGDEFFDSQGAGWSLWSFSASEDGQTTAGVRPEEEEQSDEGAAPLDEPTEDVFLSQFSDEDMQGMGAPFMDMFPDSTMHRLLSYETMLTGVLTGSEEGDADPGHEHEGADAFLDTFGYTLFGDDDPQNGSSNGERSSDPEMLSLSVTDPASEEDKDGPSTAKRSRDVVAGTESTPGFTALVLEELEDVVFQLTKRTRVCYRDAFYRLAESSRANCITSRQCFQQPDGNASRFSAPAAGCHERETNAIDRTVMVLTMSAPSQLHRNCFSDDWGPAEAQSTDGWTTRA